MAASPPATPTSQFLNFQSDLLPAVGPESLHNGPFTFSALARFEFEAGRGNEGTKVLMVEWEDDGETSSSNDASGQDEWEISWEGKSTVLLAREDKEDKQRRLYFLLPPGATVPKHIRLAQRGGNSMLTNPLPAIFPPELGSSARTSGKKGVLHTIWAKKRMAVLQKEIEQEMKVNGEGIGLEMAIQEQQWIEDNFGVGPRTSSDVAPVSPTSPTGPRSPGGGRLAEKLRGLKLGTSVAELQPSLEPESRGSLHHLLSPEMDDVAVSSFSAFHGNSARPRTVAQNPPTQLVAKQDRFRMGSLDAVAGNAPTAPKNDGHDMEDDLFAVKLSPRSPEMTKSPFSFTTKDTAPWSKDRS